MLVTSLMPTRGRPFLMRVGLRGAARWRDGVVVAVWCVALRGRRVRPGWARRDAAVGASGPATSSRVWRLVGPPRSWRGARARESGAYVPFELDESPRPLRRARGAASERLGAVEPRSTTRRRHRCHSSAGEPLVPRLTDSAVARLLWGTSEQRQRRRVSVTSSEGVYGVLSVTKTQRPTMGNARLAKLNDRVEKTGSGFARAAKTRAVCLTRALPSTLRPP